MTGFIERHSDKILGSFHVSIESSSKERYLTFAILARSLISFFDPASGFLISNNGLLP